MQRTLKRPKRKKLGEIAQAIVDYIAKHGEATAPELARALQLSRRDACTTSYNLRKSGRLIVVGARKSARARSGRPVYVMALARAAAPSASLADWAAAVVGINKAASSSDAMNSSNDSSAPSAAAARSIRSTSYK